MGRRASALSNASALHCQNCVKKTNVTDVRHKVIGINSQIGPTGSDLHSTTSWTLVTRTPILAVFGSIKAKKECSIKEIEGVSLDISKAYHRFS